MSNLKDFRSWLKNIGYKCVKPSEYTLATEHQKKKLYYTFVEDSKLYLYIGGLCKVFRFNRFGRLLGMK